MIYIGALFFIAALAYSGVAFLALAWRQVSRLRNGGRPLAYACRRLTVLLCIHLLALVQVHSPSLVYIYTYASPFLRTTMGVLAMCAAVAVILTLSAGEVVRWLCALRRVSARRVARAAWSTGVWMPLVHLTFGMTFLCLVFGLVL